MPTKKYLLITCVIITCNNAMYGADLLRSAYRFFVPLSQEEQLQEDIAKLASGQFGGAARRIPEPKVFADDAKSSVVTFSSSSCSSLSSSSFLPRGAERKVAVAERLKNNTLDMFHTRSAVDQYVVELLPENVLTQLPKDKRPLAALIELDLSLKQEFGEFVSTVDSRLQLLEARVKGLEISLKRAREIEEPKSPRKFPTRLRRSKSMSNAVLQEYQ